MLLSRTIAAAIAAARRPLRAARVRALLSHADSRLRARDLSGAERSIQDALSIDPAAPHVHAKLALVLTGLQQIDRALQHYRAAQRHAPLTGELLESFVRSLIAAGASDEAQAATQDAIRADPSHFESWFCAGLASLACHHYREGLEQLDRALDLCPENPDARANRGIALQYLGRLPEALAAFDAALESAPGHPLARFHKSLVLLMTGAYAAGWPEYETRLLNPGASVHAGSFPRWDGGNPAGLRMLVYGEQGLGDEIMFASCIPDLLEAQARCIVECHPGLERLFTRSFPRASVYAARTDKRVPETIASAGIDCAMPSGSLPLHYRRSVADFPRHRGYLRADPDRIRHWRERLARDDATFSVGVSWRGGTYVSRTGERSIPLEKWLPILRVAGLRLVSLQYTRDADREARELRERHDIDLVHWPEAIDDYDETAALVSALDLTISVCTSVAHLGGALGRPVWVMVPTNPEWRYGYGADSMIWYPSVRLFRQSRPGDWSDVIARVSQELQQHVADSKVSSSSDRA